MSVEHFDERREKNGQFAKKRRVRNVLVLENENEVLTSRAKCYT